jgi:hypothetical protein
MNLKDAGIDCSKLDKSDGGCILDDMTEDERTENIANCDKYLEIQAKTWSFDSGIEYSSILNDVAIQTTKLFYEKIEYEVIKNMPDDILMDLKLKVDKEFSRRENENLE